MRNKRIPGRARRHAAAALLATAVTSIVLGGCSSISTYSGYQTVDAAPADTRVGEDTKSTVRARLGSPSVTSTFDPNVWFYVSQVKARAAFRRPKILSREVVSISFNKVTEVVADVQRFTLSDGRVVAFNRGQTPTRGREMTVLEQLLGSVGRGGMLPPQDTGVPGSRPGDRRR